MTEKRQRFKLIFKRKLIRLANISIDNKANCPFIQYTRQLE